MSDIGTLKVLSSLELNLIQNLPAVEKRRFLIAGYPDFRLQQLVLFRGDGTSVIAAFTMFEPSGNETPDFHDLEIIDYGGAIRLGKYEASTRSILYDLDPEYKEYCESIRNKDTN